MEIDIFTLCDFAQNVKGKLTMVGTFDVIHTQELPTVHPMCSIAARIRFSKEELGSHSFKITFLDNEGNEFLAPVDGKVSVTIPNNRDCGNAVIAFGIGRLKLNSYGKHSINISIDSKNVKSLPFFVEGIPEEK